MKVMSKEQILSTICSLSSSQGFYGRLLEAIDEDDSVLDSLYALKATDIVDLVMKIEG